MGQLMRTVIDVLQELRIDLQDFAWLIAQQLRIDSVLVNASDQVSIEATFHFSRKKYFIFFFLPKGTFHISKGRCWKSEELNTKISLQDSHQTVASHTLYNCELRIFI
jgi:hypothetical protein